MTDLFRNPAERQQARQERVLAYGRVTNMRPRTGRPGEYRAKIEAPPDYLTPDQLDLFDALTPLDEMAAGTWPGGTFTSEQMRNWTAFDFKHVCQLEGVGRSDAADVLAEIDLRVPGWPGRWTEPRRIGAER
jgi:hypothetical protein